MLLRSRGSSSRFNMFPSSRAPLARGPRALRSIRGSGSPIRLQFAIVTIRVFLRPFRIPFEYAKASPTLISWDRDPSRAWKTLLILIPRVAWIIEPTEISRSTKHEAIIYFVLSYFVPDVSEDALVDILRNSEERWFTNIESGLSTIILLKFISLNRWIGY